MDQSTVPSRSLAALLVTHDGSLPPDLIDALADRAVSRALDSHIEEQLLARPELRPAQIRRIAKVHGDTYESRTLVGRLLARLPIRSEAELGVWLRKVSKYRQLDGSILGPMLANPAIRPETLDLLEDADTPHILATYAHLTPRGTPARIAALTRLETLLGPATTRMNPEAAEQGAKALATLQVDDPVAGKERLLATFTRPVLLALATEEKPWHGGEYVTARLDEDQRDHLIRQGIIPVFTTRSTQKDTMLASTLAERMRANIDLDVLRSLVAIMPPHLSRLLQWEIEDRGHDGQFHAADRPLGELLKGLNLQDKEAGARWLLQNLDGAAAEIGWPALLRLADEAADTHTPLTQLRDLLVGVATPAASA